MITLLFVAIYPEMETIARQVFEELERTEPDDRCSYQLRVVNVASSSTNYVLHELGEGDVLIARGGIVYDLKQRGFEIPVVEILVTGSDLLMALSRAKNEYGGRPAAVIGSANMLVGLEHISAALGIEVGCYVLEENSLEEVHRNVELAQKDGYSLIVGGTNGSRYASSLGLDAVLIESGREVIWSAISEARRIAQISREERQKSLMYRTIIDSAYEGVLVFDQEERILLLNTAGRKILGLFPGEYHRRFLSDVLAAASVLEKVRGTDPFYSELVQSQDQHLAVTKVPLILGGDHFGTVVTFQDTTQIQEMEGKIRGEIFSRGHTAKYTFEDIIGSSRQIRETVTTARLYAQNDSNILILGETGTGKELFAQGIHRASGRSRGPFVAVNCAALSESLLESELFGYVEGAFTGALKGGKKGLFELAHNGTIFLDEISEISYSLQGRLLRVIQEQEVRRLGHDRIIPINVRVISAANKDLRELIAAEQFREDLYYRLNIFKILIPSLRHRREDILQISEHFIRTFCSRSSKTYFTLDEREIHFLSNYSWPGNIRELRNICERLVALHDPELGRNDALQYILEDLNICEDDISLAPIQERGDTTEGLKSEGLKKAVADSEKQLLLECLRNCNQNKSQAAAELGISRVTLWRKLKALEIE